MCVYMCACEGRERVRKCMSVNGCADACLEVFEACLRN
jgi:hypothetical protein